MYFNANCVCVWKKERQNVTPGKIACDSCHLSGCDWRFGLVGDKLIAIIKNATGNFARLFISESQTQLLGEK